MDYTKYFTCKTRSDGKTFTLLKEDAPNELRELIQDIHHKTFDHFLPNDWIYSTVEEAVDALSLDTIENITIEPDQTHDLLKWLSDNSYAHWVCDEATYNDMCYSHKILDIISHGQCLAKEKIYRRVNDFLVEQNEARQTLCNES